MDASFTITYSAFPSIAEPRTSGRLKVDGLHELYWEECGNPDGIPAVYFHGGPGEGADPSKRCFWDPDAYRIVLFDQRGALRSTPLAEIKDNTTQHLINDIETLRKMLGIEQWLVLGGSWGTTLALAYGEAHPQACLGFILRGIMLGTPDEIDWFLYGMRRFLPQVHKDFAEWLPEAERGDLLKGYLKRLTSDDPECRLDAARRWTKYSGSCALLEHNPESVESQAADEALALGMGRLDAWYFSHGFFLEPDQLVRDIERISHLPCVLIQGEHDMIATPNSAYRLHEVWPGSILRQVPKAGHAPTEPGNMSALIQATEHFKRHRRFLEDLP